MRKNNLLKSLRLILSFFSIYTTLAQTPNRPEIDLDAFIIDLFPQQKEDLNYEAIYETLFQLYRNPLNLNTAKREDLESLFILSQAQINHFLKYREQFGNLLTLYELQAIPEFDLLTIQRLLPFVTVIDEGINVGGQPLWKRILNEKENHYLILRIDRVLEQRRGFLPVPEGATPQRYLGTPERLYARYRVSHINDFSLGFTLEKDSGEQLVWDPSTNRYGFDFLSYHAFFQNKGKFKAIALGDYQLQIGQGLLMSAGFVMGKGSETVTTMKRPHLGIRPYTSVLESVFLRGAAATYQIGRFDITGFASRIRRDGNILTTDIDTLAGFVENFVATIQSTGFRRTQSEINAKGNILENTLGTNIAYSSKDKNLQLGTTFVYTQYSVPLRRIERNYNQYEFNGSENYNIGIHFNRNWQNFNFFGEAAQSKSRGRGAVLGTIVSLAPNVEMAMHLRSYDRNFHTFFGSPISEGSRPINERGIYWGIKIAPFKKVQFNAYYDKFSFPWLRFGVDAVNSQGSEYLARITYQFSKKISVFAQIREQIREQNQKNNTTNLNFVRPATRRNYMFDVNYRSEKIFSMHSRVQYSTFYQTLGVTHGFVVVQDLGLDYKKWHFDMRFASFDTDDFDNRQYVTERDVLFSFSIPAYSGRGLRTYFMLRYQFTHKLDLWLRYARFDFPNQTSIGSGLEQIQGSTRSDIKVQMRIKF
ncbi:MAG: helix-hairpin-helix domain-containing protein [Microscillaceae bacterium]|nr:helix-hairpin-helix domain-containing protein [Microscillaceae bacterium]MDW8461339.1 helix-hairpin-helix domain-containing protein [Cytophagales bacterium]